MKNIFKYNVIKCHLTILFTIFLSINLAKGQDVTEKEKLSWAEGWSYAFSEEGIKNWKPEFTLRYYVGFFSEGPMLMGGVKVDDKRTFSIYLEHSTRHYQIGYYPGYENIYEYGLGVNFRRYWHLDKKKIFSFYSDIYGGAKYAYSIPKDYFIDNKGEKVRFIPYNEGDIFGIIGWQPGIRIRFYKNIHIFGGLTIASHCGGFHFGIGF